MWRLTLPSLDQMLERLGRLLIPAARYDTLLAEHNVDKMEERCLVHALGLPVTRYVGSSLDPPLRSRFLARNMNRLSYGQHLELMLRLGPNIDKETLVSILSFSHTLVTEAPASASLHQEPRVAAEPSVDVGCARDHHQAVSVQTVPA